MAQFPDLQQNSVKCDVPIQESVEGECSEIVETKDAFVKIHIPNSTKQLSLNCN